MKVDPETGEVDWTPPPALILGDTILGRINSLGESDEFSFSGAAGQKIYFDPQQYSGNYWDWSFTIYAPSGKTVVSTNFYNSNNQLIELEETGNYRIVVDVGGGLTGSYGFSLIDLELAPVAIFDTLIEGQLKPGSEDDLYRFTGSKGQKIFFDRLNQNGSLSWILYGPDDRVVTSNSFEDIELYLPADGEYKLALRGESGFNGKADYSFKLITPDEISAPMNLGNLESPNSVTGEIGEKGEEDFYTFTGAIGQQLFFDRLTSTTNYSQAFSATVTTPSGQTVTSDSFYQYASEPNPIILTEAGTYQVRIDAPGEVTGNYGFNILDLEQATPINLDTEYTGILDPGQEAHFYKFSGTKDQRLFMDELLGASGATWRLYDSGLNQVTSSNLGSDIEITLTKTDDYILAVQGNSTSPVNYKFNLITPDSITKPLTLGSAESPNSVTGEISEKGEEDFYTFTGAIGQQLIFDRLTSTTNYSQAFSATIISPSGQTALSHSLYQYTDEPEPIILTEAGTYQVRIDAPGEITGNYGFNLFDLAQAKKIDFETEYSGTLNPGESTQIYRFAGEIDRRIFLDSFGGTSNTTWTLYNSGNKVIASSNFNSDLEVVLPKSDNYTLVVRGRNGTTPVNYKFIAIVPETQTATLNFNTSVTDENIGFVSYGAA